MNHLLIFKIILGKKGISIIFKIFNTFFFICLNTYFKKLYIELGYIKKQKGMKVYNTTKNHIRVAYYDSKCINDFIESNICIAFNFRIKKNEL